jgi:hypothetical protein
MVSNSGFHKTAFGKLSARVADDTDFLGVLIPRLLCAIGRRQAQTQFGTDPYELQNADSS